MKEKSKILVVDDQPINVKLLQRKLEREGMEVLVAYNGKQCLELVQENLPNLILLDVMMPEMDGIEVCAKLKENKKTQAVPVIFITAKSTKEGMLQGLDAGAADYITKPIDLDEMLARVKTQLRIQTIYKANLDLQDRLADARQTAAIGAITQGIAHNLNNLLGVVVGYLDLIKNGFDSPDMVKRSTHLMDQAINRMVTIVRQLSSIATEETINLTKTPLEKLLNNAINRYMKENDINKEPIIKSEHLSLEIPSNSEVFETIMGKLLINAWESYPEETPDDEIEIEIETEIYEDEYEKKLLIKIMDRGTGIDSEIENHMFEPFISSKTSVGRGMGLTIARHSIRNIGGDLSLDPRSSGGVCATLSHLL